MWFSGIANCPTTADELQGLPVWGCWSLIRRAAGEESGAALDRDRGCRSCPNSLGWRQSVAVTVHPAASHHLPAFITAPGETDIFLVGTAVFLIILVLVAGTLFLKLHTLPERIAHKGRKLQFEIVAVLGLLALFTHVHLFWVAGLLLALIDFPDFSGSLSRIVAALERIAHGREVAPDVSAQDGGGPNAAADHSVKVQGRKAGSDA